MQFKNSAKFELHNIQKITSNCQYHSSLLLEFLPEKGKMLNQSYNKVYIRNPINVYIQFFSIMNI